MINDLKELISWNTDNQGSLRCKTVQ